MKRFIFFIFVMVGGCLSSSLFLLSGVHADTVLLNDERQIKGLVVEKHTDRIILSTEKGEIPILLTRIKKILYDNPEQNFMQTGRAYEAENKYGEALAYYEKAIEINPNFEEAKKAAAAMKSRFWATTTEGPQSEMDKQQAIYESWSQSDSTELVGKKQIAQEVKKLREDLGLALVKKGDWVYISEARPLGEAAVAGSKRNDCLIAIDANSLRYLGAETVVKKMIYPRFSSFALEYERACRVGKETGGKSSRDLGLKLKLDYRGTLVEKVEADSPAALAGIRVGDVIERVNGESTRYMPLAKVMGIIRQSGPATVIFSVRRSVMLTRR